MTTCLNSPSTFLGKPQKLIHIRKTIQSIRGKGLVIDEPKSEASRRPVAMPTFVRNALIDHLANRTVDSDFILATSKGTPFTPRNIIRHLKSSEKSGAS
jgi:hypothetical protein